MRKLYLSVLFLGFVQLLPVNLVVAMNGGGEPQPAPTATPTPNPCQWFIDSIERMYVDEKECKTREMRRCRLSCRAYYDARYRWLDCNLRYCKYENPQWYPGYTKPTCDPDQTESDARQKGISFSRCKNDENPDPAKVFEE